MRKRVPKMQYGGPYMSDMDRKQQGGEGALYSDNSMFDDYKQQVYGTGPGPLYLGGNSYINNKFLGAPDPSMYVGDSKAYKKALRNFGRDAMKKYRDVSKEPGLGKEYVQEAKGFLDQYIRDEMLDLKYANRPVGRVRSNKLFR